MKRPSFQFYPGDWLNDTALRRCSVPARGLWMDMICFMHQGSEYGYLKTNHEVILKVELARMVGATLTDVEAWLHELLVAGVYSLDENQCIFSRRMVNDERVREIRAAGGKLGGNPILKGTKKVNPKDNFPAESCITPSSSSSSSSSSSISKSDQPIEVNHKEEPKDNHHRFVKPTLEEVQMAMAKAGVPVSEAQKFLNHYEANGWRVGKVPMKSWPHAVGNWAMNYRERSHGGAPGGLAVVSGKSLAEKLIDAI